MVRGVYLPYTRSGPTTKKNIFYVCLPLCSTSALAIHVLSFIYLFTCLHNALKFPFEVYPRDPDLYYYTKKVFSSYLSSRLPFISILGFSAQLKLKDAYRWFPGCPYCSTLNISLLTQIDFIQPFGSVFGKEFIYLSTIFLFCYEFLVTVYLRTHLSSVCPNREVSSTIQRAVAEL